MFRPTDYYETARNMAAEDCSHDILRRGLCVLCGADLSHEDIGNGREGDAGMSAELGDPGLAHVVPGIQVRDKERFAQADGLRMLQSKRLYLILDLDETLVHTLRGGQVPAHAKQVDRASVASACGADPDGRTVFAVHISSGHVILLRPYLLRFLSKMASRYVISLYTMGTQEYAGAVLGAIDPDRTLVRGGLCAWGDGVTRTRKNLDRLACDRHMAIILDDTPDVWGEDVRSLLVVPRWTGEPTDDSLPLVAEHLAKVHAMAYPSEEAPDASSPFDVRELLTAMRPKIFEGACLTFSGLFPRGTVLEQQVLCQLVKLHGGQCVADLSPRTTHLIFRKPGTDKVRDACALRRNGRRDLHVLWESWLLASIALWKLVPTDRFDVEYACAGAGGPAGEEPDDEGGGRGGLAGGADRVDDEEVGTKRRRPDGPRA